MHFQKSNYQMLALEESSHYETLYKHYEFYPWYGEDDLYAAASKGDEYWENCHKLQERKWKKDGAQERNCPSPVVSIHFMFVTYPTHTNKTEVKCWYDVDVAVYRSFKGLNMRVRSVTHASNLLTWMPKWKARGKAMQQHCTCIQWHPKLSEQFRKVQCHSQVECHTKCTGIAQDY